MVNLIQKVKRDYNKHKTMYFIFLILGIIAINYLYNNDSQFQREANALTQSVGSRAGFGTSDGSRNFEPITMTTIVIILMLLPLILPVLKWVGIILLGFILVLVFGLDLMKAAIICGVMFVVMNAMTKKEEQW